MIDSDVLPTLTAQRIALRPLTAGDVPALYRVFSDPEVMRYWSSPAFADESEARELVENVQRGFENRTFFQWGLCRQDDDAVIGTCTLWQLDPENRRSEIGFILGREHWGHGYMSEALRALLDFAFSELGLRRLEADVDPENAPSIALLDRLGFRYEGHLRERWLVAGKVCDSLIYGLLAREWRSATVRNGEGSEDR